MRCFTWSQGKITPGIQVMDDPDCGKIVYLGEAGTGRRYERVELSKRDPAVVEFGGVIFHAHPRNIARNPSRGEARPFYVLERSLNANDNCALVRVITGWEHAQQERGFWTPVYGRPEELVKAHGARGPSGQKGTWDDGLFVLRDGDVLKVTPDGAPFTYPWALYKLQRGWPETIPFSMFEKMIAPRSPEAVATI